MTDKCWYVAMAMQAMLQLADCKTSLIGGSVVWRLPRYGGLARVGWETGLEENNFIPHVWIEGDYFCFDLFPYLESKYEDGYHEICPPMLMFPGDEKPSGLLLLSGQILETAPDFKVDKPENGIEISDFIKRCLSGEIVSHSDRPILSGLKRDPWD